MPRPVDLSLLRQVTTDALRVYEAAGYGQALSEEARQAQSAAEEMLRQAGLAFLPDDVTVTDHRPDAGRRSRQEMIAGYVDIQRAYALFLDALYRLAAAGVRVPQPYHFVDGVLLMELITDEHGVAAPRLNDLDLTSAQALDYHDRLIAEVVKMLCGGLIHGDLSEFNVLVDAQGPVIIDLPQAVDAAANNNAARMLERDVANLAAYFGQFAPELLTTSYGKEIWYIYESGNLTPEVKLTGHFKGRNKEADINGIMREINDAREDALRRRQARDAD